VAFLCYAFFIAAWPGDTVSEKVIASGSVGSYTIGNAKNEVVEKNTNEAFSPKPKPSECPSNWIYANKLNLILRSCLMNADEWGASSGGHQFCKENEDYHLTLYFSQDRLSRIKIRCTLAI
jgi:hypothetical protein